MDMNSGPVPTAGPDLSDAGMDMTNYTVASNFLQDILDDSILQPSDYAIARAFWYGIVIVIAIAAICNLTNRAILHFRYVPPLRVLALGRCLETSSETSSYFS
jgi:ferric-chelate reductase